MKSPAFQWYAADYLADEKVMCMTLEEEGAYIRLLSICWREGSIPSDESRLSTLCKGASTTVVRVVAKCFQPMTNQPDRMVHKRLQEEVEKQAEWRRKSSEGGRKSAQKRAKSSEVKPRVVEPKVNQEVKGGGTLQSSSSVFSLQSTNPLPPELEGEDFELVWKKWLQHRKEIKKKMTPTMEEASLKKLATYGKVKAIHIISFTIEKGWQGLGFDQALETKNFNGASNEGKKFNIYTNRYE